MVKEIPYSKAIRMALLTAPLFGLLGAAPILDFNRIELSSVTRRFMIITSLALVTWVINIGLLWLGNRLKLRGKDWLRYILSSAICVLVILLVSQLIPMKSPIIPAEFIKNFPKDPPFADFPRPIRLVMPLLQTIFINIVTIVLLEILVLRDKKRVIEEENSRLRMFNLEAKHSQLKQQLHPHFLFNSLSTLRSLIKRSPQQAEAYLEKLSELLRFSINSDSQALIGLKEELELTETYLNMQKVRFGNALDFTIGIPQEMRSASKLPVYSVQLLVENAIKHNILTTSQPLKIVIKPGKENNTISIENNSQPKLHIDS
jgi:two-component system LytT family sensor kinase